MERNDAQAPPTGALAGARVLLADDDEDLRRWLRAVLDDAGAAVVEAESGAVLLQRLTEAAFDLVVTDVRMSWTTGSRVLAMARAAGYEMPFVIITAHVTEPLRRELAQPGVELLGKPFEADRLVTSARRLLDEARRARERRRRGVDPRFER
ncbi:MAG: response regulator [Myxococcales bacterium]|jgi:two-component system response regulator HydG